jgi:hypothetical protein
VRNQPISLLVVSAKFATVAGGDEVHSGTLTFHYHTDDGFAVITWISGSNAYALVSDVTGSARGSCLVCHQSMADHDSFRTPLSRQVAGALATALLLVIPPVPACRGTGA